MRQHEQNSHYAIRRNMPRQTGKAGRYFTPEANPAAKQEIIELEKCGIRLPPLDRDRGRERHFDVIAVEIGPDGKPDIAATLKAAFDKLDVPEEKRALLIAGFGELALDAAI